MIFSCNLSQFQRATFRLQNPQHKTLRFPEAYREPVVLTILDAICHFKRKALPVLPLLTVFLYNDIIK